jgi:acyl-CoA synthetase (NDP forming)
MTLETLFNPSSIAIVGVSHDPKKVGYLVAKNLIDQGFAGEIFFINKNAGEDILGKKVYPSLEAIGKQVDLVVLAIPAAPAIPYLDEIHKNGCKNVVLFAAGFKEVGADGVENEQKLQQKIKEYDLNLLGPNCIGYINTKQKINTTFLKHVSPPGTIGFISQSGAIGSVMVDYFAAHKNLGFSYFISLGNKSIIDESAALEFLMNDEQTNVIGMYLEDVRSGTVFMELLRKISQKKPVVILKSGKTEEGSKAAVSHTGGLVGNDDVYDAAIKQSGAIRADSYTEFMTLLKLYSFGKVPSGDQILILSNAGGIGVLYADDVVENGLRLETISPEMQAQLLSSVSETKKISLHNPIDLLGDASAFEYKQAIETTLKEKDIGAISVLLTPQANTQIEETATVIIDTAKHFDKPIYPIFMGEKSVGRAEEMFEENRIASFDTYDGLSAALRKVLWRASVIGKSDTIQQSTTLSLMAHDAEIVALLGQSSYKPFLNLEDSLKVLTYVGVPVEPVTFISSAEQLSPAIAQNGYPLTMKIASDVITHKTEVGGVLTYLKTEEEVLKGFEGIVGTGKAKGVYLQKMVKGNELFIGAKRDPLFGVVVVMGLGGIFTELLKEVTYRIHPFSYEEFERMAGETKADRLMKGFRGSPPADVQKLYEVLQNVGSLMAKYSVIKEIDINPLFMLGSELRVVDCRIIINST